MRVMKLITNKIEVHSPETKLSLIEVAKQAFIANQESISCKYGGVYTLRESINYYELVNQNYKILVGLVLQYKLNLKGNSTKKGRTKR